MTVRHHWNTIYGTRGERDVSWFEARPSVSLEMLDAAGLTSDTCVIDIGGGDSRLVDALVERRLACVTVLDVSGAALRRAQERLGKAAASVAWIEADVTGEWRSEPVDLWHDRAVFHFLTHPEERARYRMHLLETLKAGGFAVIATFAVHGPRTCSGLPVCRYGPSELAAEFGHHLELVETREHDHHTPWGAVQPFLYARLNRTRSRG